MNEHDFIESTAAGLRKMDIKPDFLLIIASRFKDWQYNESKLCGIPVIKSYVLVNSGHGGHDYPIVPCFISLDENKISKQVYYFQRGFEEHCESF